jgi:hypothetical protein
VGKDGSFEGHNIVFHHRKKTEAREKTTLFMGPADGKCDVRGQPLFEAQVEKCPRRK